jgi:hypothetical protein
MFLWKVQDLWDLMQQLRNNYFFGIILTRTSTEHDIEIRHNLLIGFGNISDVKGGINTMNGAIAFCGVTIELAEKGSLVIQISSSFVGFLCC